MEKLTNIAPKGKIKVKGYSHAILDSKRAQRKLESEKRLSLHNGLTTEEKIEKARGRRGNSKKEINRLKKQLKRIKI